MWWTGSIGGLYEHGNKTSGSKKVGKFFDQLNDYQLLDTGSLP
jgi:hypothetical protein